MGDSRFASEPALPTEMHLLVPDRAETGQCTGEKSGPWSQTDLHPNSCSANSRHHYLGNLIIFEPQFTYLSDGDQYYLLHTGGMLDDIFSLGHTMRHVGISVLWPGIKLMPPVVERRSPNHRTTWEVLDGMLKQLARDRHSVDFFTLQFSFCHPAPSSCIVRTCIASLPLKVRPMRVRQRFLFILFTSISLVPKTMSATYKVFNK